MSGICRVTSLPGLASSTTKVLPPRGNKSESVGDGDLTQREHRAETTTKFAAAVPAARPPRILTAGSISAGSEE
ncbi:hypothetical protein J3R83DRAFT_13534 [Lanmaoa asiatica]|nr:hypothetical protein J3R83DRAFT_13534 [Lanmaoa asiatica]